MGRKEQQALPLYQETEGKNWCVCVWGGTVDIELKLHMLFLAALAITGTFDILISGLCWITLPAH